MRLADAAAVTELGDASPALEPLQSRSGLMADASAASITLPVTSVCRGDGGSIVLMLLVSFLSELRLLVCVLDDLV